MCSVNDTGDIEELSNSTPISKLRVQIVHDKCNKCKENKPHILLRNKDAYCKNCFLASTNHKFRALLGKHRIIKDNDRVLIIYTGGHSSTSLLSFLKSGLELTSHKRIRFIPVCLFVENQFNLLGNRSTILNDVSNELKKFNIPLHFTSLNNFHLNGYSDILIYESLEDFLSNAPSTVATTISGISDTLSSDMEKIYERRLWIAAAKKLNCKFIFSSEVSTNIASQILSDVALGRGCQIPSTTGFSDTRDEEVTIIRPLRVFEIKELALYNHFHNLDPVILKMKPPKSSIQNLIENFVDELKSSYPATVSTVLKTGDKLCMASIKKKSTKICYICQSPMEEFFNSLTSSRAMEFSCEISKPKEHAVVENKDREVCFSCLKIEEFLL